MLYDLIILGAGPAGLTAAIYSGRYNMKTLIIAVRESLVERFIQKFHLANEDYKITEITLANRSSLQN